jgi:hypothetical protein
MRMSRFGLLLPFAMVLACGDKEEVIEEVEINSPPVADAGNDLDITTDDAISLDGGASFDPDGDLITYEWFFDSIPEGSALRRNYQFDGNGTTNPQTTFRPDATGTWIVGLRVTDTSGEVSDADFLLINLTEGNLPVADAGPDLAGNEGQNFTLDGSGSWDPLGRDLEYTWAFETVPTGSALTGLSATGNSAAFTADVGGRYVVSLIVDSGVGTSLPDTAIVDVSSNNPLAPVAAAGDDLTGEDCTAHNLDGSASFDPNGDSLQYRWSLQSRPTTSSASNASFSDRNAAATTFFPDKSGDYTLALSVYDGSTWSSPDLLVFSATERSFNSAPVVNAGTGMIVDGGEAECVESGYSYRCDECEDQAITLGLDATVTDADGDPLTLSWSATTGTANIVTPDSLSTRAVLQDAEPVEPSACEPNEYQFQLQATDCTGATSTATVMYTVNCCGVVAASR